MNRNARRRVRPVLAIAMVGSLAAACGGGSSGPPSLAIRKTTTASGDGQTDTVLSTLPNPLRVLLTLGASPQVGDTITWSTPDPGASVTPTNSVTDATGVATTTWKLGHVAGSQTVTATHSGATGSPVTFTATAAPGAATQLVQPTGDGQAWMVGTVLPTPLTITVADQYGNAVPGIAVAWQVTSGTATVSPTNTTSNTGGVAQTTVTLGNTAGPIAITATSGSLAGSPHQFNVTAQAIPTSASVTVGPSIVFMSDRNASSNPAVDTIAAGGKVTWTWAAGSIAHSVQSTSFTSSAVQASGTYSFTFSTAGTYHYNCAVHGNAMTGTIIVR